jgi:hypothetical protein
LISESVARQNDRTAPPISTRKSSPPQRPFSRADKLDIQYGARRFKARLMPREPWEVNCCAPDRGVLRATHL